MQSGLGHLRGHRTLDRWHEGRGDLESVELLPIDAGEVGVLLQHLGVDQALLDIPLQEALDQVRRRRVRVL